MLTGTCTLLIICSVTYFVQVTHKGNFLLLPYFNIWIFVVIILKIIS